MRWSLPSLIILVVLGARVVHADPWVDADLRILSYNIYHGGQATPSAPDRGSEWLDAVRSRNPDIILIQEANGWLPSDSNYVAAYVESLNTSFPTEPPYTGWVGDANSPYDLAILTRFPVVSMEIVTEAYLDTTLFELSKGFFHAVLEDSLGPLHIIDLHLAAGEMRADREMEGQVLIQVLDGIPASEPVWIGGDFNSYSPVDVAEGSPTPPAYDLGAMAADAAGWEPAEYLLDRGYKDAFRSHRPSDPGYTKTSFAFHGILLDPSMRVDFLLCSPAAPWFVQSAEVVTDGLADAASDHYAVFAVYERLTMTDVAESETPARGAALRCHPNPFTSSTTIEFGAAHGAPVRIDIYSVLGRRVRTLVSTASHFTWDGADESGIDLPGGWYFVRAASGTRVETARVLRVR